MILRKYSDIELDIIKKYISCDALMLIICDAIMSEKPLSIVRFSDGERAIMRYSKGGNLTHYLTEEKWLTEYGLMGANLTDIGKELFKASEEADIICPNISGLFNPTFGVLDLISPRSVYAEAYFGYVWKSSGRLKELFDEKIPIGIVTRNTETVSQRLKANFSHDNFETAKYDSWRDTDRAIEEIGKMKSRLIFCAGGASMKYLCVKAARLHNKVVVDAGSALTNIW